MPGIRGPVPASALVRRDTGPLFCVTTGKRLEPSAIAYMFRRRAKAAGLAELHPHMLRHLRAHHMQAAGMQETQIMKLAGWSSPQQLLRYGAALATQRALDAASSGRPRGAQADS
jgi:integrase